MTKEEIKKFLDNTKVYVNGKSKEIQEKLFSFGYKWDISAKNVSYTDKPFLFIWENKTLSYISDMHYFINHQYREITAEEILSLEITETSYRPFKNAEECWNEMLKHQPFGWLKHKKSTDVVHIESINTGKEGELYIEWRCACQVRENSAEIFDIFVFADGEPFGIKEE